ncbi:TPA: copper-binding protein [Salmonella enterica]|nr:copper-binding protein [Salmonella enterica]
MMNNGDAFAHQQMAQTQKTSAPTTVAQRQNATPFSEMNDHEKAMVIHQSMNNAHSFAHESNVPVNSHFQIFSAM